MRAVLNETLRLFPPVPLNERATLVPVTVPTAHGPLYIPKGVPVIYSALLMQRRKDLWGEDADEFDPERWLDERNKAFVADPMRFVPFNAGPRIVSQMCCSDLGQILTKSFVTVAVLGTAICIERGHLCCYQVATEV